MTRSALHYSHARVHFILKHLFKEHTQKADIHSNIDHQQPLGSNQQGAKHKKPKSPGHEAYSTTMRIRGASALLGLLLTRVSLAADSNAWRGRTIYQVFTDRFARTDGSTTATCDTATADYCGGTWAGLINRLDYIQDLGFDAVWISPVTHQVEGTSTDGSAYHGYWQDDINKVNEHFGTADDLRALSAELHSRGMVRGTDWTHSKISWA